MQTRANVYILAVRQIVRIAERKSAVLWTNLDIDGWKLTLVGCHRYDWYDSNYGSSYTARKEEHAARILGTSFKSDQPPMQDTGSSERKWGRSSPNQGGQQAQQQKGIFAREAPGSALSRLRATAHLQ